MYQREVIRLYQIKSDRIESYQIIVRISDWIGSEQTYWIGTRGLNQTEKIVLDQEELRGYNRSYKGEQRRSKKVPIEPER